MSQNAPSGHNHSDPGPAAPSPEPRATTPASAADIKRWRQYLADERAEASVYRDLAQNRSGEERDILLALADAEGRHEAHWLQLLGEHAGRPRPCHARPANHICQSSRGWWGMFQGGRRRGSPGLYLKW